MEIKGVANFGCTFFNNFTGITLSLEAANRTLGQVQMAPLREPKMEIKPTKVKIVRPIGPKITLPTSPKGFSVKSGKASPKIPWAVNWISMYNNSTTVMLMKMALGIFFFGFLTSPQIGKADSQPKKAKKSKSEVSPKFCKSGIVFQTKF